MGAVVTQVPQRPPATTVDEHVLRTLRVLERVDSCGGVIDRAAEGELVALDASLDAPKRDEARGRLLALLAQNSRDARRRAHQQLQQAWACERIAAGVRGRLYAPAVLAGVWDEITRASEAKHGD